MQSPLSGSVGIRREDKSHWERRAVLAPSDVSDLLKNYPHLKFFVQPSKLRIFSDYEYEAAGATIREDLSNCDLILGVKEVPSKALIPDKTYMFFSHVIKAQAHNMDMLDTILERRIRLIDYEKIVDEQNNRLIAFGVFAGIAGAIDFLAGFGQYLLVSGFSTPLLNISYSYKYFNLEDAYTNMNKVAERLQAKGIDESLCPMIFAVTGSGKTANGALKVLKHLPVTEVEPDEIQKLVEDKHNPKHRQTIYLTTIRTKDVMISRDTGVFDKQYYTNPEKFKCVFAKKYLPYITCLFHCVFWDSKSPRYIKNKHLEKLAKEDKLRLIGICDVSCDADGSIQCLKNFTSPDKPFFFYDSITQEETYDFTYKKNKLLYLAIDYLPSELAYDATTYFSSILKKWIPNICQSDPKRPLAEQGLSPELARAVIACSGSLTPSFQYITKMRNERTESMKFKGSMVRKVENKKEEKDQDDNTNSVMVNRQAIVDKAKITPVQLNFDDDS